MVTFDNAYQIGGVHVANVIIVTYEMWVDFRIKIFFVKKRGLFCFKAFEVNKHGLLKILSNLPSRHLF